MESKNKKRLIRKARLRKKISGTSSRPRFCVFKSNCHLYAQIINDEEGKTLVSANDAKIKTDSVKEKAKKIGEEIAKKCLAKKINQVVFDRSGYKYTGIVKIIAEAARKKGLKF